MPVFTRILSERLSSPFAIIANVRHTSGFDKLKLSSSALEMFDFTTASGREIQSDEHLL